MIIKKTEITTKTFALDLPPVYLRQRVAFPISKVANFIPLNVYFQVKSAKGYLEKEKMEQLAYQNPNPVLRAGADGKLFIQITQAKPVKMGYWNGRKTASSIESR